MAIDEASANVRAEQPLPYAGLALDRATDLRGDPSWLAAQLKDPRRRVIPMWRDKCLVIDSELASVTPTQTARIQEQAGVVVLLGIDGVEPIFAADLSHLDLAEVCDLVGAAEVNDTRDLYPTLSPEQSGVLTYARGMLYWHRTHQYCGVCGAATQLREGGHQRVCTEPDCSKITFPRIEPAIIVLAESAAGDRCLLGRHQTGPAGRFSTLAGFVEVGESFEDAVRREVHEEAGIQLGPVRYVGSQPWPFPASLMVGYRAVATSESITVDGAEIVEARWFTRQELTELLQTYLATKQMRHDSISQILMESWLRDVGP